MHSNRYARFLINPFLPFLIQDTFQENEYNDILEGNILRREGECGEKRK